MPYRLGLLRLLCGEAVYFSQSLLLGTKQDTDKIADAFLKVYEHRDELT
ncbi:MAG: hypothetical protein ACYTG0_41390 [Planctomycetota bacterium]